MNVPQSDGSIKPEIVYLTFILMAWISIQYVFLSPVIRLLIFLTTVLLIALIGLLRAHITRVNKGFVTVKPQEYVHNKQMRGLAYPLLPIVFVSLVFFFIILPYVFFSLLTTRQVPIPTLNDVALVLPILGALFIISYVAEAPEYGPKKVFVENYPFLAQFVPSEAINKIELPFICRHGDSRNLSISLHFKPTTSPDYLEIELQAAGLTINGDLKQRQPLATEKATYEWNCNFSKAGKHEINLVYRIVDQLNVVKQYLEIVTFELKSIRLYRQYSLTSLIATVVTLLTLLYTMRVDLLGVLHGVGLP